jgi:Flp pilus assembly protein TadD
VRGSPGVARGRARPYSAPLLVFVATAIAYTPVLSYPFLNWDDVDVFVRNDELRAPGLLTWAFTTRYMEHYQPLAWLVWGAMERTVRLTAASAHALNVTLHASCAALVYVLVRAGLKAGPYTGPLAVEEFGGRGRPSGRLEWIAAVAAMAWAIHPLRVEVVAWASAMPYTLALLCALASMLAWLRGRFWTAVGLFMLSLLARPIAFALPVIWLAVGPAKAGPHDERKDAGRHDGRKDASPYDRRKDAPLHDGRKDAALPPSSWRPALAGLALATIAALVESSARLAATLAEFGIGPRLTLAASAPWRYLWRTIAPFNLTPLDPLALTPRTDPMLIGLGLAGTALVSAAAWRWRRRQPVLAVSWLAYLALLVPAMGLVPSGLQATADRYTYLPAVAISVAIAAATTSFFRLSASAREARGKMEATDAAAAPGSSAKILAGFGAVLVAALTAITLPHMTYWRDSIALWTRAVEIDPRNDVALYNLGAALDEAGRTDDAVARYEQVLVVVPNHPQARRNRDLLRARQLEEEGNRFAAAGSLTEAVTRYADAVRLDPRRTHSHAALGMALTQLGRTAEARPHLQAAVDQGVNDPSVPNALAFTLARTGDRDGALAVLRDAQRRFPRDPNIARNIAVLSGR